jgi:hypothetical protein
MTIRRLSAEATMATYKRAAIAESERADRLTALLASERARREEAEAALREIQHIETGEQRRRSAVQLRDIARAYFAAPPDSQAGGEEG